MSPIIMKQEMWVKILSGIITFLLFLLTSLAAYYGDRFLTTIYEQFEFTQEIARRQDSLVIVGQMQDSDRNRIHTLLLELSAQNKEAIMDLKASDKVHDIQIKHLNKKVGIE